jgi:uncharacterized protein
MASPYSAVPRNLLSPSKPSFVPKTRISQPGPEHPVLHLLDVNVLLSLCWEELETHEAAHRWFKQRKTIDWATCEITESAFLRLSMNPRLFREPATFRESLSVLEALRSTRGHMFLSTHTPLSSTYLDGLVVRGYRQVTDATLLALARQHDGMLATFDRGIANLAVSPAWKAHLQLLPT